MTPSKLFLLLFSSVLVGIALGALIGWLLGALTPNLVELFVGRELVGNSVRTGLVLGILNGGIYGFIGGIVLVISAVVLSRRRE